MGEEIFEATYDENPTTTTATTTTYTDQDLSQLLAPENLEIAQEEWALLIRTDPTLAGHVGHFFLKRNKNLQMMVSTSEQCTEEHR